MPSAAPPSPSTARSTTCTTRPRAPAPSSRCTTRSRTSCPPTPAPPSGSGRLTTGVPRAPRPGDPLLVFCANHRTFRASFRTGKRPGVRRRCLGRLRIVQLDHALIAVHDLVPAARELQARHGLASLEGGRHPGWGTANRIVPLGETYLELVAIVDEDEAARS